MPDHNWGRQMFFFSSLESFYKTFKSLSMSVTFLVWKMSLKCETTWVERVTSPNESLLTNDVFLYLWGYWLKKEVAKNRKWN